MHIQNSKCSLYPKKSLIAFYNSRRYRPTNLYTYKHCYLLELHHQIQILLIGFTALTFILLHYSSTVTQMLCCTYSDRDLLQLLKEKAQPKLPSCKQIRDHERKTNHKKNRHLHTYPVISRIRIKLSLRCNSQ